MGITLSFSGTGQLTKVGSGTLTISANQAHTGEIVVDAGVLRANATVGSSRITVNGGAVLGGTGVVNEVVLHQEGIIAPGNSIGSLHTGSQIWNGGAVYQWEIDNLADPAQWDLLEIDGTLTLNPGEGPITLLISQLNPETDPDLGTPYRLTIVTTTDGIIGFSEDAFHIGGSGGSLWDFAVQLSEDGRNLELVYHAIPEPTTGVLFAGGVLGTFAGFRRRRQSGEAGVWRHMRSLGS